MSQHELVTRAVATDDPCVHDAVAELHALWAGGQPLAYEYETSTDRYRVVYTGHLWYLERLHTQRDALGDETQYWVISATQKVSATDGLLAAWFLAQVCARRQWLTG